MKYTKEDFLKLIDEIAEDNSFKKVNLNSSAKDDGTEQVLLSFYDYGSDKYVDYFNMGRKVKYEPIKLDAKVLYINSIEIRFEKEPPIRINYVTVDNVRTSTILIPAVKETFFGKRDTTVTAVVYKKEVKYRLSCGTYSFDLTMDEADAIYEKMDAARITAQRILEDKEIEKRMKRYNQ